jgi:hypothetical protein
MSLRGVLIVVALILGLLFYTIYTGKAQEWWGSMTRAATQVNAVPPDSVP